MAEWDEYPGRVYKPLEKVLEDASLAAGASSSDSSAIDLRRSAGLFAFVECTFASGADGDLEVYMKPGVKADKIATQGILIGVVSMVDDSAQSAGFPVDASARWAKFYVKNKDSAKAITAIAVWAAPLNKNEKPGTEDE